MPSVLRAARIAVLVLGLAAILLIAFGWSGTG
jgi:hypothetical protein